MRIATWNVNGMKARLAYLARFLVEVAPDVIGLQELKMVDDAFPRDALEALGYHALTHGQKSWNGVAILSREPAETLEVGLPGQEAFGARLLSARVGGLTFTTVYCPNGKSLAHEDFPRKLGFLDALADFLEARRGPGEPAVLCGDFNVVPAPIDSWDEARHAGQLFHTPEERARVARLHAWGWRDLYRERNPDDPGHTWWDYRGGAFHKREGLRIDLVLGTAPVASRVTDATVDRKWRKKLDDVPPSDHAPVWVDLA